MRDHDLCIKCEKHAPRDEYDRLEQQNRDLLAALERLEAEAEGLHPTAGMVPARRVLEVVRPAIAKAKGETP